jgi:hypothetical protein
MPFRVVCKSMKTLIEELPEFEITLSLTGTAKATSYFFSHFKGNLTVTSKTFSRTAIDWFLTLIDSVQYGVKVEKASTICVNSRTASSLSETLERVLSKCCSAKISHISICFEGSTSGFRRSLSAISKLSYIADEIEISADLSFRSPLETLWGINQQIMSLGSRFTVRDLCIRFALYLSCNCASRSTFPRGSLTLQRTAATCTSSTPLYSSSQWPPMTRTRSRPTSST